MLTMIRKKTFIFISALFVSFLPILSLSAQSRTSIQPTDTLPVFRGVAVGVDLLGAGQRWLSSYGQYEAQVRLNLKDRYFPVAEVGLGDADAQDETTNLSYKTSAPYARLGIDFNILKNKHDLYRFYIGARVAYTSFAFDLSSADIIDPVWGGQASYQALDQKCNMLWAELSAGVDATIWKWIHMGWSVRYRSRLHQSITDVGEPWYVPGFGRNASSRLGATFNLIFEI